MIFAERFTGLAVIALSSVTQIVRGTLCSSTAA